MTAPILDFNKLLDTDVRNYLEQDYKGLNYLSWATAYQLGMQADPSMSYEVLEDSDGLPLFSRGNIHFVKTTVTMFGITKPMQLPVMDTKHNAVEQPNSRQVSDCIMRCLVKNIAMFGIGLRVFRKEGLEEFTLDNDQMQQIAAFMKENEMSREDGVRLCYEMFGESNIRNLTRTQATQFIDALRARLTETALNIQPQAKVEVKEEIKVEVETETVEVVEEIPVEVKPTPEPKQEVKSEPKEELVVEVEEAPKPTNMMTKEQYTEIASIFKEKQMPKEMLAKLTREIQPNAKKPTDLTFDEAIELIEKMKQA